MTERRRNAGNGDFSTVALLPCGFTAIIDGSERKHTFEYCNIKYKHAIKRLYHCFMTGITINRPPNANYSYYTYLSEPRLPFVFTVARTSTIFMGAIQNFYLFTSLFNLIILLPINYLHSMKVKVLKTDLRLALTVYKLCHKHCLWLWLVTTLKQSKILRLFAYMFIVPFVYLALSLHQSHWVNSCQQSHRITKPPA